MKLSILNFLIALLLGLMIGAVMGTILDRIFGVSLFAYPLLREPWDLNLYIIKIEVQPTPASLLGMAVIGYLVIKKG